MLTPIDFKNNYFSLLTESQSITGVTPGVTPKYDEYKDVTEDDKFTVEQWSNLVKVASIIKANENRFEMQTWHKKSECGTIHCIAGWAESLVKKDTNYLDTKDTWITATDVLSEYAEPFFFIEINAIIPGLGFPGVGDYDSIVDKRNEHKGLPEQLVMKWFIDPILEEARKESHELSSEISQFIQKAQGEFALA
jgi:hypothetical protein